MPPAKYSNVDAGGVSFQVTQNELKQIKTLVVELQKMKTLYEAQMKIRDRIWTVQKETMSGQKLDSHYQRERLRTLENIYKRMRLINEESLETLKRENPFIARSPAGESKGRYNYTPADAETTADAKRVEAQYGQKLIGIYAQLKKSYSWQLLYFAAASILIAGMLANSKVFGHFMDVIGSALGFIMDMILISVIPYVILLVKWLFDVGNMIAGWPDIAKVAMVSVGLLLGLFAGVKIVLWIGEVATAIKLIGTAATVASGAEGVGLLSAALAKLPTVATIVISIKIIGMEILGYLAAFATTTLPSLAGQFGPMVGAFMATQTPEYKAEAQKKFDELYGERYPGVRYDTPAKEWPEGLIREMQRRNSAQWVQNTTIIIDGKAIDESMYRAVSNASLKQGIPRSS